MKRVLFLALFLISCASTSNDIVMASFGDAQEYKKICESTYHYKNVRIVEVNEKGSHYFVVKYDK